MANGGRPIFPGSDVDDQLKRIFRFLVLSQSVAIFANGLYFEEPFIVARALLDLAMLLLNDLCKASPYNLITI